MGRDKKMVHRYYVYRVPFVLCLILTLIIFTACEGSSDTPSSSEGKFSGKYGVKLYLEQNSQQETELYKAKTSQAELKNSYQILVENHGPVDTSLKFKGLASLSKDFVTVTDIPDKSLSKATNPGQPIQQAVLVDITVGAVEKLPKTTYFKSIVDACYPYETQFNELLCLKGNPNSFEQDPICEPSYFFASSSGQGAPVAVDSISYSSSPADTDGKVRHHFTIRLTQLDRGESEIFLDDGSFDACGEPGLEEQYNHRDRVSLVDASAFLGTTELSCSAPDGSISIYGGNGFIECDAELPVSSSNIQTPLQIKLKYLVKTQVEPKPYKLIVQG